MRLIDADELNKKENMDYVKISTWDEFKQEFVTGTLSYISPDSVERAKTVDAVPVVRCKDCRYCECPEAEKEWCKKGHLYRNGETWFCADGKRKDGETDGTCI